ncbi:exonuclease domain-containing protein [Nodularia sp. NIES-3585]|uniref:exonuclease domain-containing protein n=1 Tax=Nodularia sp. NIES-3585 TaxID=1973477 RepID=UPI000B5C2657|nr:exonuclease domain-containing protein [Nodularia sp. NIES-3585]GAX34681.1 exonuclease RNase T and DNA polymerase III [Nodularia sp. NIES-3585]
MDFVVLDTEGQPELSELALIDSQGLVIYEGFSNQHPRISPNSPNLKSLKTLLTEFLAIVQGKTIICHYAEHDIDVLKYNFRQVGLIWPNLKFECTWTLAKNTWQGLESYSLDYLSKYFNLRANQQYFISDMAHTARYDAEFTYHLYIKIILEKLKQQPNPFSSSRVDTPFQNHPDYLNTYQREFLTLKTGLNDIKRDTNHQSKGIVVIGEPGSGKTHLMMRLAQERLSINRLLFIRQPNNSQSVLYHIYSRILESLVQKIGHLPQLDYLIINTFRKILSLPNRDVKQKDIEILKALYSLEENHINALGAENTQRKREYWLYIEKTINEWWMSNYAAGSFALSIIKGMVKYCSYTDYRYKNITTRWLAGNVLTNEEAKTIGLPNWGEEISQEAFSLEAISVLGKLSTLDEPLIIIFDQLEGLGLPHNKEILLNFGEAIKEIFTHVPNSLILLNLFPDRWEQLKSTFDNSILGRFPSQVYLRQPTETEIKAIIQIKLQSVNIDLEQLFHPEDLDDILVKKPIRAALNCAADYYNYRVHGIPLTIEKKAIYELDNHEKIEQQLRTLQQQQQTSMEVLMQLIQAIQEPAAIDLTNLHQKLASFLPDAIETFPSNPVIEYLIQHKNELEQKYNNSAIITDYDDIGKLKTIAEAFNHIKPIKLTQYRLGKRKLPEHIVVENGNQNYVLGFLQINGISFTSRMTNFNELVNIYPQSKFELFRDERLPEITGKVGKEYIKQLQNSQNGKFTLLNKQNRILLDLIYDLIISIYNKDLYDIDLATALNILITHPEWYHWIFSVFGFTPPTK